MDALLPSHRTPLSDRWSLWRDIALRGAGFTVQRLEGLVDTEAVAAVDAWLDAQQEWDEQREICLDRCRREIRRTSGTIRAQWRRARRKLGKGRTPPPSDRAPEFTEEFDRLAALEKRATALRDKCEPALARSQALVNSFLVRTCDDSAFREAIIWQNRRVLHTSLDVLTRMPPEAPESYRRRHQQLVTSYLQRYCAKNDTIGFFGPVGWARFENSGPAIELRPGPQLLQARQVHFEYWVIDVLAEQLRKDQQILRWLSPRLNPQCRLDGRTVFVGQGRQMTAQTGVDDLISRCDGKTPAQTVAERIVQNSENPFTSHQPHWLDVGQHFETGPCFVFDHANPVENQLQFLERFRPDYLVAQTATLEQLALAAQGGSAASSLMSVLAVSQQVTPDMRATIENILDVTLQVRYGLTEIGDVAALCPEGRRYHVFSEHCHVEIVDEDGRPSSPGEYGRILVTALLNRAMPLIRYDTDDRALAVEGPCPCGRTLPSFGPIRGRYRRRACLPEGTWDCWRALQRALRGMPAEDMKPLRQYQLHQYRDQSCELRVAAASDMPQQFTDRVQQVWAQAARDPSMSLRIVSVDRIERSAGGKYQDFTSDFFPSAESENVGISHTV